MSSEAKTFPCPQCGASMVFDTASGRLSCPACKQAPVPVQADPQANARARREQDFQSFVQRLADEQPTLEARVVDCPACGAQTRLEGHVAADRCAFCATPLVLAGAHSQRLVRPQAIVPFAIDRSAAQRHFAQWLSRLWFAPNALKRTVRQADGIRGVYLPYWTYDAHAVTRYRGERGTDRTVTERDSQGSRTRTETDWSPAAGVVELRFDDILVVGSPSVPSRLAASLEGWELHRLEPYRDELCAGFTVEVYRRGLVECFAEARDRMEPQIDAAIRRDIGGDHQRIHAKDTSLDEVRFKHLLLPLWIGSYRFRDHAYQVLVNAQTGNVTGDRPWSWWKVGLAALAALIVLVWLWNLGLVGG